MGIFQIRKPWIVLISMKVLIIARYKEKGYAPFVSEQVAALEQAGTECVWFPMFGNGISGYLKQLPELKKVIRQEKPDIIHAHFVFSGLFANLQQDVPVVTTYHGSDGTYLFQGRLSMLLTHIKDTLYFRVELT